MILQIGKIASIIKIMTDKFTQKYNKLIEAATWMVVIIVIFAVRFLPSEPIGDANTYYFIGGITAFALLYYLVIYKYFSRSNRIYLKNIADIILIGVLIHLLKDYGNYFFALYFLPLAAAALSLEFINALLIATIAAIFVIFEIFLGSYDLLPSSNIFFQGFWQIGLILFITIFCRFLANDLKREQALKEESLARQKSLEEESKREKEFLALASHQLYTPLSIMRGISSMLKDETLGKLELKQKKAVEEIYINTKRMVNLVSELLSVSKIQSGKFQITLTKTNLSQVLQEVVDEFNQIKNKKKVSIKLNLPTEAIIISADDDKIRQVCINLIDNALKYMDSGFVTVSAEQNEVETIVSVSDQGIGIPEADREKIFEPFFRGKNILELDNKGTGLGLFISKLIISRHGGRIWYESTKEGTTFKFSIPEKINLGGD